MANVLLMAHAGLTVAGWLWTAFAAVPFTTWLHGAAGVATVLTLQHVADVTRVLQWRTEMLLGIAYEKFGSQERPGGTCPGPQDSWRVPPDPAGQPAVTSFLAYVLNMLITWIEPILWESGTAMVRFLTPLVLAGIAAVQLTMALWYWVCLWSAEKNSAKAGTRYPIPPVSVVLLTVIWRMMVGLVEMLMDMCTAQTVRGLVEPPMRAGRALKGAATAIHEKVRPADKSKAELERLLARIEELESEAKIRAETQPTKKPKRNKKDTTEDPEANPGSAKHPPPPAPSGGGSTASPPPQLLPPPPQPAASAPTNTAASPPHPATAASATVKAGATPPTNAGAQPAATGGGRPIHIPDDDWKACPDSAKALIKALRGF